MLKDINMGQCLFVMRLLENSQFRDVLRRSGSTGFPKDPTWSLAMLLVSQVAE